jgi:hypothetical protein
VAAGRIDRHLADGLKREAQRRVESGAFLPLIVPVWNEICPPARERGRVMSFWRNRVELCFSSATMDQ